MPRCARFRFRITMKAMLPTLAKAALVSLWQSRRLIQLMMLCAAVGCNLYAQSAGRGELPSIPFPGPPNALSAGPLQPTQASPGSVRSDPFPAHADSLYLQLSQVSLDPARVFHIREASLDRESLHITLEDGTIAFTEDVMGRVTGAFFAGEGEVLIVPAGRAEQLSMGLFAGTKILEERFTAVYLRFNDDTFETLRPFLRSLEDTSAGFYERWQAPIRTLAGTDALRLFVDFSRGLPNSGNSGGGAAVNRPLPWDGSARLLHLRITGSRLGTFDVTYDQEARERINVAQLAYAQGTSFYDLWTSFNPAPPRGAPVPASSEDPIRIRQFRIQLQVTPPRLLTADATLDVSVAKGGQRTLLFELSRFLRVEKVEWNGAPIDFLHNPAMEGTQLARRGNDVVAVVFPRELVAGEPMKLHFVYEGEVLSEAATGLLYVGERGTWYPNRGLAMANFDLEFRYPPEWKLVATGVRVPTTTVEENRPASVSEQVSHWVTERPIPVAGFNLGKYERASARAGDVDVSVYATRNVENNFPRLQQKDVLPQLPGRDPVRLQTPSIELSPARNAQMVADQAASAVKFFSKEFGPYPYRSLSLTQIPGSLSQGWPGLVFLSTYAFLTPEERVGIRMDPSQSLLDSTVVAHETAHQWWGDAVLWGSYRDQWIVEALANYSALLLAESGRPADARAVLDNYRAQLLQKAQNGLPAREAGAVTLGARLTSSKFPDGYEAISYGRGTWLFHMLRCMLRDSSELSARTVATKTSHNAASVPIGDALFLRDLRRMRERYEGRTISTRDLQAVFEQDLPPALWFDGKPSLDWFFEGWVNGTAIPRLRLTNEKMATHAGSSSILASGVIQQQDVPDDLVTPVPVYAEMADKSRQLIGVVLADGRETNFRLSTPAGTVRLLLDPDHNLLTQIR